MSFEIIDSYVSMAAAAATKCDFAAAVRAGEKALAIRERMTDLNGVFTTYRRIGERGYAWFPGEVKQYRELLPFIDGSKGKFVAKLPLEWAVRRDPERIGLKAGFHRKPVDLGYWKKRGAEYVLDERKDTPSINGKPCVPTSTRKPKACFTPTGKVSRETSGIERNSN